MAAITEQELDSLLSSFDQIYEDFKSGVSEIQFLRLSCNAATKEREALEVICNSLKQENEQLKIFYTDSLKHLVDQFEWRTQRQSLKEELKKVNEEHIDKEARRKKKRERDPPQELQLLSNFLPFGVQQYWKLQLLWIKHKPRWDFL
ncbi:protein At-4/1-like [Tripterygium wilfordii]|uniref:protein At-4/1-like n=1 Tax=Tripterygium wilfordii TaxID=458696 RepID=UPI0018F817C5|nr:protein At-4/1-like [Tripterygium wilfordii]